MQSSPGWNKALFTWRRDRARAASVVGLDRCHEMHILFFFFNIGSLLSNWFPYNTQWDAHSLNRDNRALIEPQRRKDICPHTAKRDTGCVALYLLVFQAQGPFLCSLMAVERPCTWDQLSQQLHPHPVCGSQSVVPTPTASVSYANLLEIQIRLSHPGTNSESGTLEKSLSGFEQTLWWILQLLKY